MQKLFCLKFNKTNFKNSNKLKAYKVYKIVDPRGSGV